MFTRCTLLVTAALVIVSHVAALNILSYNIQHGAGFDQQVNLSRQAQVIIASGADLVALQEVDNRTRRTHDVDQTQQLSQLTSLPFYSYGKMRNFEGGGYGIAIVSRFRILKTEIFHYHLPNETARAGTEPPARCDVYKMRDYCQGALAVLVQVPNQDETPVWFVTTHLGLEGVQLNETKQFLNEFMPRLQKVAAPGTTVPVILTGDFNSVPNDPNHQLLRDKGFADAWQQCGDGPKDEGFTFNSEKPFERIDFVYYTGMTTQPKCKLATVPNTMASDHRPVLVKL